MTLANHVPLSPLTFLAHSRVRVLLVSPALLPPLGVSSAAGLPVETVVLLPGDNAPAPPAGQDAALPGATPYQQWPAAADSRGIGPPGDEDAMIAVNYTSGTTGRPKGVVHTHRAAYLNGVRVADEHLAPVPADGRTVGEILVRSNTAAVGGAVARERTQDGGPA